MTSKLHQILPNFFALSYTTGTFLSLEKMVGCQKKQGENP
jgi:hypothetical protein